jgi:hypothetical protein
MNIPYRISDSLPPCSFEYQSGCYDAESGRRSFDENPYAEGTDEHRDWLAGWHRFEEELRREFEEDGAGDVYNLSHNGMVYTEKETRQAYKLWWLGNCNAVRRLTAYEDTREPKNVYFVAGTYEAYTERHGNLPAEDFEVFVESCQTFNPKDKNFWESLSAAIQSKYMKRSIGHPNNIRIKYVSKL